MVGRSSSFVILIMRAPRWLLAAFAYHHACNAFAGDREVPALVFDNRTDGRFLADLSTTSLRWTGCRDDEESGTITGATASNTEFSCPTATMPLKAVPGTALVNLILNGTFPGIDDPYVDDNLAKLPVMKSQVIFSR